MPFHRPHEPVMLDCGDEEITKQSHKEECDIHFILDQYKRTGVITHVQNASAQYMDIPSDVDYQLALNTVIEAEEAFAALPATVRAAFDNDPGKYLAAFDDDSQHDKLRDLGVINRRLPDKPDDASAALSPAPEPVSQSGGGGGGGLLAPAPMEAPERVSSGATTPKPGIPADRHSALLDMHYAT